MPHNLVVPVTEQEDLGSGCFRIRLAAPAIAAEVRAGQFIMLGLPDIDAMLVRRPFSVAAVHPEPGRGEPASIDVLYKIFGRRTLAFSHLRPGARMSVLGPLGRGFWAPEGGDGAELFLVAGGIGNAPFPLLLQQLGPRAARTTLFFGGRIRGDLSLLGWFRERCGRVVTTTEDGSEGERGMVIEPFIRALDRDPKTPRVVMACGPRPMLRAVAEACLTRNVPCQLAVEETMACGFGVCLGCVVEKSRPETEFDRFVRACTEGPVFDAREIVL
jgi:dihydroorotate dehydrogenase electron transfer subunit